MQNTIHNVPSHAGRATAPASEQDHARAKRPSRQRLIAALAVAALSDIASFGVAFALPLQWVLDLVTAFLLFLILGRRWAILPGLVAEAIPGLAVFPAWVLVVLSIYLFDGIKARRT